MAPAAVSTTRINNSTRITPAARIAITAATATRDRQGDRSAINGARPGKAEKAGLGDRPQITGGRSTPDHYPEPRRDLLAALCQRADDDGQQHLQRLALRRCVA